ncbi:hypothetical protein DSECCO2_325650 [anaerobic digester metagenome]
MYVTVHDLLLQRARHLLCLDHMLLGDDRCGLLAGHVAGHADQAPELPQAQRELPAPSGAPLGLFYDLHDRPLLEVGDLLVLGDLLSYEPYELGAVILGVVHGGAHVHLVTVAADAGTEGGVHPLDGVHVARADQYEVAGHRLGLDHGPGASLRLPGYAELALLESGQQGLLGLHPQHVDLVHEQHALGRLMDGADLQPLVGRGLQSSGLERVVLDIAQQSPGVGAGGVDERYGRPFLVGDQQLGDHVVLLALTYVSGSEEYHGRGHYSEQQDHGVPGVPVKYDRQDHHHHDDGGDHGGLLGLAGHGLLLLGGDDLLALSGRNGTNARLVGIVRVVVGDHVLQLVLGEILGHGLGQHRFACARLADEHDMALLLGRLLDDLHRGVLTDDLVGKLLRDLDVGGGRERLGLDPGLHVRNVHRLILDFLFHASPCLKTNPCKRCYINQFLSFSGTIDMPAIGLSR